MMNLVQELVLQQNFLFKLLSKTKKEKRNLSIVTIENV